MIEVGGFHLERPGGGGESGVYRSSTELLPSSRLKTTKTVWWLGLALIVGWANSWTNAGLRPGKSPSLFFSSSISFLFFSFLFCFGGFN
jgi:hypothetical protein